MDNIRIKESGESTFKLWDTEKHLYWNGSADADCPDDLIRNMDDLSSIIFSDNNNSTASLTMQWSDNSWDIAQIEVKDVDYDWSEFFYFKFDVYRPSSTSGDVNILFFIYDGTIGTGTETITVKESNTWQTVYILIWTIENDLSSINEIKFVVLNTDEVNSGILYFDNLYVGGYVPEETEVDLDNLTGEHSGLYKHVIKDYSDGLTDNEFDGVNGVGGGNQGLFSQQLSNVEYKTQPALKVNYILDQSSDSFAYYYNTLNQNSEKKKFVIYIKGGDGANNPNRLKIEFHDSRWQSSGYKSGNAYCYVSGIRSDQWHQWIIDIEEDLLVQNAFDIKDLREVVVSLDNRKAGGSNEGKTGCFYVDDLTFLDSSGGLINNFPGIYQPADPIIDVFNTGVRYLLDDYDGRVLDTSGDVVDLGFNEFFGLTGISKGSLDNGGALPFFEERISSSLDGGTSFSFPYSYRIDYDISLTEHNTYVFYFNLMATEEANKSTKDLSFADRFSIWLKGGGVGNNPGLVKLEFHDERWRGLEYSEGIAIVFLKDIPDNEWAQYWIDIDGTDNLIIPDGKGFHWDKLKEVVISFDYKTSKDKSGSIFIDDMFFVDTDQNFSTDQDFDLSGDSEFLKLVEKRTFQYFMDSYDPTSGLVLDRVHFRDLATISGTGFGLTAMVIGTENEWISEDEASDIILKTFNSLLNAPTGDGTSDIVGYEGFYYHFLDVGISAWSPVSRKVPLGIDYEMTKIRDLVELSSIDTALLMAGVLTCREYFSQADHYNQQIVDLADQLYESVNWEWFLDTQKIIRDGTRDVENPHYNQFFIAWKPEWIQNGDERTGFGSPKLPRQFWEHWDIYTDEAVIITLLALASPTSNLPKEIFYNFNRFEDPDNDFIMSWNSSMFHYFFANCWFDFYGNEGNYSAKEPGNTYDEFGVNWWKNSVKAGIASRNYSIEGTNGRGRTNISTYHENSWGLSSCEAVPSGLSHQYIGENGFFPSVSATFYGFHEGINFQSDGTVPTYGGISMIGFSGMKGGIPLQYFEGLMKNYYQNTQLWTGWDINIEDFYIESGRNVTVTSDDNNGNGEIDIGPGFTIEIGSSFSCYVGSN